MCHINYYFFVCQKNKNKKQEREREREREGGGGAVYQHSRCNVHKVVVVLMFKKNSLAGKK